MPAQEAFDAGSREYVQGNNDAAVVHLDRALALHPGFVDARYMLALAQLRMGSKDAAVASLEQVVATAENTMLRDYAVKKLHAIGAA